MEKMFVCQVCGHIEFENIPEKCPVCTASKDKYVENAEAIMESEKEGKEKHIPEILVTDDCGLIPDVCRDIHIKVGSTPHPMTEEHWINWIDIYVNKVHTGRSYLQPNMQPAVSIHLKKENTGTLNVIEHCNKHGSWLAEAQL